MSILRNTKLKYSVILRLPVNQLYYSTHKKSEKPLFKFTDPNADLLEWVTQSSSSPSAPLVTWYKIELELNDKLNKQQYYPLFHYVSELIHSDIPRSMLAKALEHPAINEMINHLVYPYIKDEYHNFGKQLVRLGYFPINWKLATITLRYLIKIKDDEFIWKLFELSRVHVNLSQLSLNNDFYDFLLSHYCHQSNLQFIQLTEFLKHHQYQSKWYYKGLWLFYSKAFERELMGSNQFISINENQLQELMTTTVKYFDLHSNDSVNLPDGSMLVYIIQAHLRFNVNQSIIPILNHHLDLPENIKTPILQGLAHNYTSNQDLELPLCLQSAKITPQQRMAMLKLTLNYIYDKNIHTKIPFDEFLLYLETKEYSYPIYCILIRLFIKHNRLKDFKAFTGYMESNFELDTPLLMTIIKGCDHFSQYHLVTKFYEILESKLDPNPAPHNITILYMNSLRRNLNLDQLIDFYQSKYLNIYSNDLLAVQMVGFTLMKLGDLNRLDVILINPLLQVENPSLTLLTPLLHYRFYLCCNHQLIEECLNSLDQMFKLKIIPNFKVIRLIQIHLKHLSVFKNQLNQWNEQYGNHIVFRMFKNNLK